MNQVLLVKQNQAENTPKQSLVRVTCQNVATWRIWEHWSDQERERYVVILILDRFYIISSRCTAIVVQQSKTFIIS